MSSWISRTNERTDEWTPVDGCGSYNCDDRQTMRRFHLIYTAQCVDRAQIANQRRYLGRRQRSLRAFIALRTATTFLTQTASRTRRINAPGPTQMNARDTTRQNTLWQYDAQNRATVIAPLTWSWSGCMMRFCQIFCETDDGERRRQQ